MEKQGVPPWSLACEASALVLSYIPKEVLLPSIFQTASPSRSRPSQVSAHLGAYGLGATVNPTGHLV